MIRRIFFIYLLSLIMCVPTTAKIKEVTLKFIETTDVHGAFFPTNYMTGEPAKGSMARVSTYIKEQRSKYGENLILLENGDILQGQPTNYYWNYINTNNENIASSIVNYLKYDAQVFGNHDVETSHAVYDKWIKEVKCPVLAANMVSNESGKPYTFPYLIIKRDGVRIAILGMITSAIPNWLSEDIWEGIHFEEMVESSRKWIDFLKKNEHPDLIIGLFHSGRQGGIVTPDYTENVSERIAREVPGFDAIFYGHDHIPYCSQVKNQKGNGMTWIIDPSNNAHRVGEAVFKLKVETGKKKSDRPKIISKSIEAQLISVDSLAVDEDYMAHFADEIKELQLFTHQKVGVFDCDVFTRDCFFGSSALCDLILNLQLKITGAEISFNAPLLFDAKISKGEVTMADMFNLYKYENKLYVMRMTGKEIHDYLEMSYAIWTNQMKTADDHIMLFSDTKNGGERQGFKYPFFNFDSAAGIIYEVDVTKPEGHKLNIISLVDGTPFDETKWYKVAVNSYRGNGGGELMTRGAGIPKDSIESRIVFRSELDQRYYLMKEIERMGHVNPQPNNNWKFVPEDWAKPALERDRKIMYKAER